MRAIPRRVRIDNRWYDVREGWAGKLELHEYMKAPEYTANEPFVHINNFYHVFDSNGGKVGEIDINNRCCSGVVL